VKAPVHPGRIVRHACLDPLGLSVSAAARALGVSRQTLSRVVNERAGISPDMAIRLERVGWGTADTWVRMQAAYDVGPLPHLPDVTERWAVRLARVAAVNRRINAEGITRPPRDPDEQEFLEETGQEGPFTTATTERAREAPLVSPLIEADVAGLDEFLEGVRDGDEVDWDDFDLSEGGPHER
jgi:antitoxin HigA-1